MPLLTRAALGWLMRTRRLVRDYETLPASSEAFIYFSQALLMSRRLARTTASRSDRSRWTVAACTGRSAAPPASPLAADLGGHGFGVELEEGLVAGESSQTPPRGLKGLLESCGEAAVDDLFDAQLLARTDRARGVLESLFGFLPGRLAAARTSVVYGHLRSTVIGPA